MRQKKFWSKFFPVLLIWCCIGTFQHALCQVKFYTVVSEQEVSYNQTFKVQYVIQGASSVREFKVPLYTDFQLEEVFELSSTPALDPKTLKLVDQHSKVAVLTPIRTGNFVIPSATAIINGKKMRSNTLRVKVKASGLSRVLTEALSGRVNDASELKEGEDIEEKVRSNFFLRVEVNKTSCYIGEPLMAVYKAYSRLNANSHVVKRPAFTGFSVIEMVDGYEARADVELYNGTSYYVHLIRKVQLFPLQEGKYELDPAEIEGTIHFIRENDRNSTGPAYSPVDHQVIVNTKPVAINVFPLPEIGQPKNFNGAVGQYSLKTNLEKNLYSEGEVARLQVTIAGSGNLPLVTPPIVDWPDGIEGGEPNIKETTNKFVYPVSGTKTFEYSFVSLKAGEYLIPKVSFSYFDPIAKQYRLLEKDSIAFSIQPAAVPVNDKSARTEYLTEGFKKQYLLFALIAIVIIGWITYQLITGHQTKRKETKRVERVVEEAEVNNRFERASLLAEYADGNEFYQEAQRVLWKVAAEKCQVTPSAFNKQNISNKLIQLGIPSSTTKQYLDLIQECELALYGGAQEVKNRKILLERAEELVQEILNA